MKRPVVFAGPSIATRGTSTPDPSDNGANPTTNELDLDQVELRGPASAGDILDAVTHGALAIALIDGFFDRVPAPWHKELLVALDAGIPVIGGASLGALRAAELDVYGMVGVGWVYSQFASGDLNDDDEVAVAHHLGDSGFRPVSDAMVDIRWALGAALADSRIEQGNHDQLIELAKNRFYAERSYTQLRDDAGEAGLSCAADPELWRYLSAPARSIKFIDAHAVIGAAIAAVGTPAPVVGAEVPETGLLKRLRAEIGHRQAGAEATAIVQELRLDPGAYQFVWSNALRTELAAREAARMQYDPPAQQVDLVLDAMGFDNELGETQKYSIARREAAAHHVNRVIAPEVDHRLVDTLHVLGLYREVKTRVDRKTAVVGQLGQRPVLAGEPPSDAELIRWYFEQMVKQQVPSDVDHWVTTMGYRSTEDFADTLLREWAFQHHRR